MTLSRCGYGASGTWCFRDVSWPASTACFTSWVEGWREDAPDIVAIDGKTSRRSHARRAGRAPRHLVSAWASRQRLVLGQQAVAGKSNEITAIPLPLERLALTGALVTLEASGTRNKIAEVILRQAKPTTSRENRRKLAGWNLDDLDERIKGAA